MIRSFIKPVLIVSALALAGCTDTLESAGKAERPLPPEILQSMKAKGMTRTAPVMVRIFKEEGVLEVWKQKDTGRYDIVKSYEICKWSGKLGPKYVEGDRQAPEGFYTVRPAQMNPNSRYHLSFNMGFPNQFDLAHGRTGRHLMVHGDCSSAGCYSMTDPQVEEIYAFARDAFRGGQREFQIQAYPFRMTPENMARYRNDPNFKFWKNLKEGYDHFEITKVPPKVDVCEKRYVFNQIAPEGESFRASGSCPAMSQPETLMSAYGEYQSQFSAAFDQAVGTTGYSPPLASIQGIKEATLVADWSKRRARGERVSREPPSLRRDAPVGEPPKPVSAPARPAAEQQPLEAEATATAENETAPVQTAEADNGNNAPAPETRPEQAAETPGIGSRLRKRLLNPFGN